MSRRNRVRNMMMKPYANAAKIANAEMGSSNDPAGLKAMGKGFMNAMKTMRNTAGQKLKNVRQTLKNKYNVMKTESMLENNFFNRPNIAGMQPGKASRNLLKVANKQQKNKEERARRNREARQREKNSELYTKATVTRNLGGLFF